MAAEIKYRVNNQNDVWLTDDVYRWNLPNTTLSMLWVDVIADGDITIVEQKKEDWCRFNGRDDKGDFYRYWFSFINNSGYERRNEYEFSTTVGDETASFTLKIIQKGTLPTPTTAENINRIIKAKSDIKQAIENKGVTVGDMTIDGYAAKINEIPQEVTGGKWVIPNGMKFGQSNLTKIDTGNMDISNVTDMGSMFYSCSNVKTLDLSSWDTSNVTNMAAMFNGCSYLTTINGNANFNTSNVTNMNGMFSTATRLKTLDVSNWNTTNVTNMKDMFKMAQALTTITGIENFITSNVTDMSGMFAYCPVTELDLSSWNTTNVRNMSGMFNGCKMSQILGIGNWNTSNVTDMSGMFNQSKITQLDLTSWNLSKVKDMSKMFYSCSNLTEIKMGGELYSYVDVSGMFDGTTTTGTFYYNPQYDYSKIIAKLPSTWTAVPME